MSARAFYFGCIRDAGHSFHDVNGRHVGLSSPKGVPWDRVDQRLTPKRTKGQGDALLHHKDGWTALALHDYTVDDRPGSNSVFLIEGTHDVDGVLAVARKCWPAVVARIGAPRVSSEENTQQ